LDTQVQRPGSPNKVGDDSRRLNISQKRELEKFGRKLNRFGVNFAVCDTDGMLIVFSKGGRFESDQGCLSKYGQAILEDYSNRGHRHGKSVGRFGQSGAVLGTCLVFDNGAVAALIDTDGSTEQYDGSDRGQNFSADERGESSLCAADYLIDILEMFAEKFESELIKESQIDMVSSELAQTYEELVLLHKLNSHMKVTESDSNYLQMACDNLTDIVSVAGIAILLERVMDEQRHLVLTAGSGVIDVDERMAALLQDRLMEQMSNGKEALLDSEVDSPFTYEWPENVENIIAVPLYGKDRGSSESSMIGLMAAINRTGKDDFDSTDVKLFNSVANGCAVFVENGRLFLDLKELFIGSLHALTNSIDAKDRYTRGHSERVAFISRWIAERIAEHEAIDEDEIHRIYLAGLLHDIGKMGIREAVLRKKGRLTKDEIEHIRTHPSIGAGILGDIKQMRSIVPGILCHHERIDGRGYPNGLTGEHIPLVGRIVGLADGFDAMTSKRVYRDALSIEEAMAEIEKGLGTQFDEKIGRIFIDSDVNQLWDIIQDGSHFMSIYGKNGSSGYGALAVGTLIR